MRKFSNDSFLGDRSMSLPQEVAGLERETVLFADVSPAFSLQGPDVTNLQALLAFSSPIIFQKTDVQGAAEILISEGVAEYVPVDPLYTSMWHLSNPGAGLFDINVETAWDDYTGSGVQVTVFDVGFDTVHADLAGNYLSAIDYDYTSVDFDPTPTGTENHGTAVMGIIGAVEGNSEGGVGVAFDAGLVGYRGFALGASNSAEEILDAAGLGDGVGNTNGDDFGTDVINVSGGYGSSVFISSSAITSALGAMEMIADAGRGGLGTIYVKSSGNSRAAENSSSREEGVGEAFDSTAFSINVAALRADGWVTDFSTPGANVLVAALADNTSNISSVVTTDRTGTDGYSSGDYTFGFGGTSSAAPQVAGVVALMLEANAELGWRDVQTILSLSARNVGSEVGAAINTGAPSGGGHEQATQLGGASWFWNAATDWNGGGRHFSNDYGYGLVDATAAVRLAESWTESNGSFNRVSTFEDDVDGSFVLDASTMSFTISETTDIRVEHVALDLEFSTTFLADMELFLTSPGGTRVQLIADTGDSGDFSGRWMFGTTAFMGETSAGDWTLEVFDDAGGDPLTITDADLITWGSALSDNQVFYFTNEYSDYAGIAGHSDTSFDGGTTGIDVINAVAVSSDTTIDLEFGTALIDGVAVTGIVNIENVYTGDGNDTIVGNASSGFLYGGRGADMIIGGTAFEDIFGGAGNDDLRGGNGDDVIDGGVGDDLMYGQGDDDTLNGGDGNDTALGGSGDDTLNGDLGNDILTGQSGNDTINGGEGDDTINGSSGDDILDGGLGADSINGGGGADNITGSDGDDVLNGAIGEDIIFGGTGNDTIFGNNQSDTLYGNGGIDTLNGGAGNDTMYGGGGNDALIGSAGQDMMFGQTGNDNLSGGAGGDDLFGGDGADTLNGGGGNDILNGGTGADIFVANAGFRTDRIQDFEDGIDLVDFSSNSFANDITDVLAAATQVGANVRIEFNANNILILEAINLADLDATDFIF